MFSPKKTVQFDPLDRTRLAPETPIKPPLSSLISTRDFQRVAQDTYSRKAWAFISSAATDSLTHQANQSVYSSITLRPRVLCDVSGPISLSTTILSQKVDTPIFAAPTSLGRLVHPDGEAEIARGCALVSAAQVLSTSASCTPQEVFSARNALSNPHPIFFQLYVDRDRAKSEALVREAVSLGAAGIFLTVDHPVVGKREADERVAMEELEAEVAIPQPRNRSQGHTALAMRDPESEQSAGPQPGKGEQAGHHVKGKATRPEPPPQKTTPSPKSPDPTPPTNSQRRKIRRTGTARHNSNYISPSLTWYTTLPWLCSLFPESIPGPNPTPLVIKGIQTPSDALRAISISHGAAAAVGGIVMSNHGGRNLDTTTPSILILLGLQRCCPEIFAKTEVLIDGGIMRGTDVFKALCLGAKAVGIGRGVLWALGYGAEGVARYFEILNEELETTMRMCGITSLDQVHPGLLNTRAVDHLVPDTVSEEHPYVKWRQRPKEKL